MKQETQQGGPVAIERVAERTRGHLGIEGPGPALEDPELCAEELSGLTGPCVGPL